MTAMASNMKEFSSTPKGFRQKVPTLQLGRQSLAILLLLSFFVVSFREFHLLVEDSNPYCYA